MRWFYKKICSQKSEYLDSYLIKERKEKNQLVN